jgi:hypothetical protein
MLQRGDFDVTSCDSVAMFFGYSVCVTEASSVYWRPLTLRGHWVWPRRWGKCLRIPITQLPQCSAEVLNGPQAWIIHSRECNFFDVFAAFVRHHGSRVSYDMTKELTMKGTVTEYQYQNPQIYIMYDVKDEKGDVVHWGVETIGMI